MNNQPHVCWECKEEKDLKASGLCYICEAWIARMIIANDRLTARINGRHYIIEDECSDAMFGFRGFGGQEFTIKFHDGRVVKTTNLWAQGVIPERFRERLPDNAEFVGNEPSV